MYLKKYVKKNRIPVGPRLGRISNSWEIFLMHLLLVFPVVVAHYKYPVLGFGTLDYRVPVQNITTY